MDVLQPALNAALNTMARERPDRPLEALATLLCPDVMRASAQKKSAAAFVSEPLYKVAPELRVLMGQTGRERCMGMRAEEILHELIRSGVVSQIKEEDEAPPPGVASANLSADVPSTNRARALWQRALKPALQRFHSHDNAWARFEIHKRPTELCRRWDYDAGRDAWECSETLIKMEGDSFAKGAMRECYRMKKMSQVNAHFFFHMAWEDCNNYVAKRYMKPDTPASVYFDDIKMQMVSKRYARLYNGLGPPKGVDFLQAFVIEVDRGGETLTFAVERAMEEEGAFVKYNNNSGFVEFGEAEGDHHRLTPHAFSRFTFDRSAGSLMVVDIQGCDDVYTDPQIHTLAGTDYGDGNLGVGGMALFFSTAEYDSYSERLGLLRFSLSPAEEARIQKFAAEHSHASEDDSSRISASGATVAAGGSGADATVSRQLDAGERANSRLAANYSLLREAEKACSRRRSSIVGVAAKVRVTNALASLARSAVRESERESVVDEVVEVAPVVPPPAPAAEHEAEEGEVYEEFEVPFKALPLHFLGDDNAAASARRAAGLPEVAPPSAPSEAEPTDDTPEVASAPAAAQPSDVAIGTASPAAIGAVHAKMCEYALVGRLPLQEGAADAASAGHHLVCAAAAGDKRALTDLRSLARGLPASEVLVGVRLRESEVASLAEWLPKITLRLATAGDVSAMLEVADQAAGEGRNADGAAWLRAAVRKYDAMDEEEQAALAQFGYARYKLLEKLGDALAEAGKRAEAGEAYQEASEAAMEIGKAKISMKLAARAEEMAEEEEEGE